MPAPLATAALADARATLDLIERWVQQGWLRELDAAFAAFLAREVPEAAPLVILAAALASHQLGHGHACLDLEQTLRDPRRALALPAEAHAEADGEAGAPADAPPPPPAALLEGLTSGDWRRVLQAHPDLVGNGPGHTPLVCVGNRLYLRRYWCYEQDVRSAIDARLATAQALPGPALRPVLDALFPPGGDRRLDWQKLACALAARSAFAVITGGPGTGKTTTVVRLLALLQALALGVEEGRALRIRLAAPTGKAAARLSQSISSAVKNLPLHGLHGAQAVREAIPSDVTTLHRLLGGRPDSRHFRHHVGNPLPLDVLVVDEASMVDLEMMAALLGALRPEARLVLLGDKDQLASVEAGSVLAELCSRAQAGHYTPATAAWLAQATGQHVDEAPVPAESESEGDDAGPSGLIDAGGTPLDQAVAMLRHSHRFGADSDIGRLAAAVNGGCAPAVRQILAQGRRELACLAMGSESDAALRRLVIKGDAGTPRAGADGARPAGYRAYLQALRDNRPGAGAPQEAIDAWAAHVLDAHGRFQLLCALRQGPWGVQGLNQRIAAWLHAEGLLPAADGWYAGRPVLVTRNDYGLGLMNGDIGITLQWPGAACGAGSLRVAFPSDDGSGVRWVQPSRLQDVQTVFAMTVHKSQGSEFTHAALVLPDRASPVLTRELVYTGITRAKSWFSLVEPGPAQVLEQAVRHRVLRFGGLMAPRPQP